jgi:hypothetical protein
MMVLTGVVPIAASARVWGLGSRLETLNPNPCYGHVCMQVNCLVLVEPEGAYSKLAAAAAALPAAEGHRNAPV